jgi:hypothetical protein
MPQYANEVPVLDVADKIGAHPLRIHRHIRGDSRERLSMKMSSRRRTAVGLCGLNSRPSRSRGPEHVDEAAGER